MTNNVSDAIASDAPLITYQAVCILTIAVSLCRKTAAVYLLIVRPGRGQISALKTQAATCTDSRQTANWVAKKEPVHRRDTKGIILAHYRKPNRQQDARGQNWEHLQNQDGYSLNENKTNPINLTMYLYIETLILLNCRKCPAILISVVETRWIAGL